MSKIIFLDIDGTLVDFGHDLTEKTREALLLAKAAGHTLMLCTGRTRCQIFKELLEDNLFDGMIASAGAYVEYKGKQLYEKTIEPKKLSTLVSNLKGRRVPLLLMGRDCLYTTEEDRQTIAESFEREMPGSTEQMERNLGHIVLMEDYTRLPVVEKLIFQEAPCSIEEIGVCIGRDFEVVRSSFQERETQSGEISIAGITKAAGIQYMLDYLNLDREDTVAFGDSYNDLEMLEYVNIGVAMGNAVEAVKQSADMVTEDIKEDGIYQGFLKLGLI